MLQIKKRDGELVSFNPTKILNRIKKAAKGLKVNTDQIFINVITSVPTDGIITTVELDTLIANTAAPYTGTHYDYSNFAASVAISSVHKQIDLNFYNMIKHLSEQGIVNKKLVEIVEGYGPDNVQVILDFDRNDRFNFFAWKNLETIYLLKDENGKVVESPQHMYLRIALWVTTSLEEAREVYDALSNHLISCATPIMINSGTKNSQLASCVLQCNNGDSREELLQTLSEISTYSSAGAGIGLSMSNIRSKESRIKSSGGYAGGLLKYLKIVNESLRFFNQQGRRPGACAIYIEPWHKDIMDLLDMKKNTGAEEMRAKDLFTALMIPDNFMRAIKENTDWYLFCPNDIIKAGLTPFQELYGERYEEEYNKAVALGIGKKVDVKEILMKIISSQIETGVPYILYKDHINNKTNHQNYGTIHQSNLCVAPETLLLTDNGYMPIISLEGQKVNIWNGFEWSEVTPTKTNDIAKLYTVTLSDGSVLDCTNYHKWFINLDYKGKQTVKHTFELKPGDRIIKHDFPLIDGVEPMLYPYTHGLFCADGQKEKGLSKIQLYGEKQELIEHIDIRNKYTGTYNNTELVGQKYITKDKTVDRTMVGLPLDIEDKFFVPLNASISDKLSWLAGYLDGDGTVALNKQNGHFNQSLQAVSVNKNFILEVKLLLNTLGIKARVTLAREEGKCTLPNGTGGHNEYDCNAVYRLTVSSYYTKKLLELGLNCHRLNLAVNDVNREAGSYVTVVSIEDNGRYDETYCFTEPKRNSAIFNGVITSQCSEIAQFSSPGLDGITAICSLSSIVLKNYLNGKEFNFELLGRSVKQTVKLLNRVIDINNYVTDKGRRGGLTQRAMAIGVQGLADLFYSMDYSFTSPEVKKLNKDIFETIYYNAIDQSCRMVEGGQYAPYDGFHGSPMSKGIFQFNMWGIKDEELSGMYDWEELRQRVIKFGICNSLFTGIMPTASSSAATGSYEMTEPADSNLFNRRVIGGEFLVVNKHMIADFDKIELWNEDLKNEIIMNNGSIQEINFQKYLDPEDKNYNKKVKRVEYLIEKYKTVWEYKQKDLIDLAIDRAPFIDQTQSMNVYMSQPTVSKLTSLMFYGWEKGIKTNSYYLRTKAISTGAKHLAIKVAETVEEPVLPQKPADSKFDCFGCSA